MRWLSRLVSIGVIVIIVLIAAVLLRSKMPATTVGQRFTAWATFRDGSRLAVGSPVVIAGVRVGDISKLTVEGDFARVDMTLRDDLDIPADSWITKRAESAFGDSYLEIIPSSSEEEGAPNARRLRSGERIVHVIEGNSTDTVLRSIARAMPKIDQGLDTVHDFALETRKWSIGTLEEGIVDTDRWLAEGHIDRPIDSADRAIDAFERRIDSAADSVQGARPGIDRQLDRLADGLRSATERMKDAKTGLAEGLANAREGMDRIDPTVEQMAEVMREIDEGHGDGYRGTLGKLVNDPTLANEVTDATADLRDGTESLNKLKSWLGARIEYDWFSQVPRVYASAEIRARNDKFYLIEIERGPLGALPKDELVDSAGKIDFTRYQTIDDGLRFTAEFGKTFGGWLQLRGGIKDSTIGIGSDILLNKGRLRFSADVFGAFVPTPRLKLAGAVAVFRSIYVLAGVDDALNSPGYLPVLTGNAAVPHVFENVRFGRDWFLGAALHFDDADLAALLRVYAALIVSAL